MSPSTRRRRNYASIIVVPPERDEPLNFSVPGWAYYLLLGGLASLVVMVIGGIVLTSWLGVRLREVREIEERNFVLEVEAAKVNRLERELEEIEDLRLRVLELAGVDVRAEIEARSAERVRVAGVPRIVAGVAPVGEERPVLGSSESTHRGTMPSLWPVEGVISREFRMEGDPSTMHLGIDIAASFRADVRASGAGAVVFAGRDSVFGQLIVVDHGKNVLSYYGHNSTLLVGRGDQVKRGQSIAHVGSTGESSAPHLHFEVRRNGEAINPRSYLVD